MTTDQQPAAFQRLIQPLLLGLIVTLGLGLRGWGLNFGLPYLSNFYIRPDESLVLMPVARFFESNGNPGFFIYPALMMAVHAAAFHIAYGIQCLLQTIGHQGFSEHFVQHLSGYLLLGRGITAALGTGTIFFVYGIGRRLGSAGLALTAALLYAVSPAAVCDAHFLTTDTPMIFFLAGAVYAALRYMDAPSQHEWRWLALSALLMGLALSAKYMALLFLPVPLLAVILKHGWHRPLHMTGRLWMPLAVIAVVFILANPYAILNFKSVAAILKQILVSVYIHRWSNADWTPTDSLLRIYLLMKYGPGETAGLMLCFIGLLGALKWRQASALHQGLLAFTLLCALLPLFPAHVLQFRYALPSSPWVAVLAAQGLWTLLPDRSTRLRNARLLLIGLLAVAGGWRSTALDRLLARDDTRSLAGQWIQNHVAPTTPIVLLGAPECEPQIPETTASISRRIDYVHRLYGRRSGKVVSEIYRLQLQELRHEIAPRYDVWRRPTPADISCATQFCLVIPSYPLPSPCFWRRQTQNALALASGNTIVTQAVIHGIQPFGPQADINPTDAFFLPMSGLKRVRCPGPNLDIFILSRKSGSTRNGAPHETLDSTIP